MKLKTLLLGLGRIASKLEKDPLRYHPCTHAGVILNSKLSKNFQLLAAFDPDQDRIQEFISDWNLKPNKFQTNIKQISNMSFDFAVIASDSKSHFENIEFCAKNGIQYILVEKPICMNQEELKKINNLVKKFHLKLWVNHERRYHPIYRFVKEKIDSGEFGKIKTIKASVLTSSHAPGNAFTDAGPLLHDGTHAIDYIDYLIGKQPNKIHYKKMFRRKKTESESRAIITMEYPESIFVFLEAGGERNYFQYEVDIETTRGRFVLSNDGHRFYLSTESKLYKGFRSLEMIDLPKFKTMNPWLYIYQEIIDNYLGKTNSITGSLEANSRIFNTIAEISK
ncbi:MAG: Gfo/Idh/MocA family oxidoreductase [Leptospiraceae bacterium]|nr:Gfo/Idh/MocA family oxidoreductase [Leptospiraceae bacterium]